MPKYDAIIIGSGLGGLTSAATLSKKGKKVLVLESHYICGGAATCYERDGIIYEVGLHEMDWGTSNRDMKHIIFKKLGILDTLPMISLPQTWRIKNKEEEFTIPEGRKEALEYLSARFPNEKKGLQKYFTDMKWTTRINKALPNDLNLLDFFLFPFYTLPSILQVNLEKSNAGTKLDKYFKSNKLKNILNCNLAYYDDDPYSLSWYYHASAQYSYYNSAKFIQGGSQVLSNQLVDIIQSNQGEVRTLSEVTQIIVKDNKAIGVIYQDKKTKNTITEYGNHIIANCSPQNIYDGQMAPKEYSEPSVKNLKNSSSLITIYITFKKSLSKIYPNMAYSTFIMDTLNIESPLSASSSMYKNIPVKDRDFVIVDYSAIDSELVKDNDPRSFACFCTVSSLEEWENLTKEEYTAKKEEVAQSFFNKAGKFYKGIKDNIEHYEVATPKTIKRYLKTPSGTAYGFKQQLGIFVGRAPFRATQIKNLHYTGAWTFPGGGFTGAIIAGYASAIDLLLSFRMRIFLRSLFLTISIFLIIHFLKSII